MTFQREKGKKFTQLSSCTGKYAFPAGRLPGKRYPPKVLFWARNLIICFSHRKGAILRIKVFLAEGTSLPEK